MPTYICEYCHQDFFMPKGWAKYCEQHRVMSYLNQVAHNAFRRAESYGLTAHYTGTELYQLLERYGTACMRCGKTKHGFMNYVADHIVPLSLGGPNTIDNIQVLCFGCNGIKRNYTIDYRQFAKPLDKLD